MYNWEVAEAFLNENGIIKQHIDSYNDFIDNKIQEAINETGVIEAHQKGVVLKLGKVRLEKPRVTEADGSKRKILPMEARLRNRSYMAPVYLEMTLVQDGIERSTEEVLIGELPVMVKSKLCYLSEMSDDELIKAKEDPMDPGGYFIINGSERVLVAIEDLAPNRTIISTEKRSGKDVTVVRIFSVSGGFRAKIGVERKSEGIFYISFPASPKNLNIVPVLKALGLSSDKDLFAAFHGKKNIINDLMLNMEAVNVKTQKEAIDYIGKRVAAGQPEEYRRARALQILDNYLLPHIGKDESSRLKKAYFLCKMIEKATDVATKKRGEDDKDHYANKRIKLSGMLMDELFRYALGYFVKDVNYQIDRVFARGKKLQIKTLVRPDAMTDRIRYAMATGNWVGGRTGVSQLLDRITWMSAVSHMRRVISPLSKVHPHFEARDLHPTHWGKICPNETPEGQSCGLVKNFAIGCVVSREYPEEKLEKELNRLGVVFKK
ncbi:MAG: DNA-directed RNA polymerase subunit B'' [Candidatus Diapherotrites archaeon]|nr:DNA-directed RNA polymerase subunit B'' [Candidatus Diapherotrites archaeon]